MEKINKLYKIKNPKELKKNKKLDYIQLYTCFVDLHDKYNNMKEDIEKYMTETKEKEYELITKNQELTDKIKNLEYENKELNVENKAYYNKKCELETTMKKINEMSQFFFLN